MLTILSGIHSGLRSDGSHLRVGTSGSRGESPPSIGYPRTVDTYSIYGRVDHLGTVGKIAPGLFAQEGRCWRMVYENPVGQGGHCMERVAWSGRNTVLKGRTKVCSCD
jgi:hypothetical protein